MKYAEVIKGLTACKGVISAEQVQAENSSDYENNECVSYEDGVSYDILEHGRLGIRVKIQCEAFVKQRELQGKI
ncbi:hypothetical protein C6H66_05910 [Photorhabdus hindustanensis]|uniref:Uncharacterized protein n=1 Tax=Photorhabdus hindustanensis TaxID=2918802 RepID=A0A2S8Q5I4_9GAMM|nr:hypothetical protein [Photorhabdus akhurstii]PQQ27688.1 hypothetical protein C6H66_05910 [Photorhabdus hindustanensis]